MTFKFKPKENGYVDCVSLAIDMQTQMMDHATGGHPDSAMMARRVTAMDRGLALLAHPQRRTLGFHRFYEAPVRDERPTRRFEWMDDERVAFRLGFILEELKELLFDGFGIEMDCMFSVPESRYQREPSGAVKNPDLPLVIQRSNKRDLFGVADALGDLNVVVNGFACELGLDMQAIDREIAASNFTKMGGDGNPIIGDGSTGPKGKVLKGPHYRKPNLEHVIRLSEEGE